ncbi:ribonuclease P protein subunit p25-like protein [Tanacetum coccineum]
MARDTILGLGWQCVGWYIPAHATCICTSVMETTLEPMSKDIGEDNRIFFNKFSSKFYKVKIGATSNWPSKLQNEKGSSEIVLRAMGRAINKTVTIVELIKRRIVGLHQITSIGSTDITDTWEPLENVFQDAIPDEDGSTKEKDGTWPFHNIVEQLILDTFDPGTMTFGEQNSLSQAFNLLDKAFDSGINFFDSAKMDCLG